MATSDIRRFVLNRVDDAGYAMIHEIDVPAAGFADAAGMATWAESWGLTLSTDQEGRITFVKASANEPGPTSVSGATVAPIVPVAGTASAVGAAAGEAQAVVDAQADAPGAADAASSTGVSPPLAAGTVSGPNPPAA